VIIHDDEEWISSWMIGGQLTSNTYKLLLLLDQSQHY